MADKEEELRSWYNVDFFRGLMEPALLAGVPKPVLIWNAMFAVFLIMNFGFFYILIFTFLVHFLAIYVCKGDVQFFDCIKSYMNKKRYYNT